MNSKRIISTILALLLLIGVTSAFAASAGSSTDPLISRSYINDTYIPDMLDEMDELISDELGAMYSDTMGSLIPGVSVASYSSGKSIGLNTGNSITLISGSARLTITSGTVVNATTGQEVSSGSYLAQYNRYIAAEATVATVSVTAASVVATDGTDTGMGYFTDVMTDDWFYNEVNTAYELGLVNGKTTTVYEPGSSLTIGEAITLAARIHQIYHEGSTNLTGSGAEWYLPYVDYALENGLIAQGYSNYSAAITRQEFVHILYCAMPADTYTAINTVKDGAIPDVKTTDTYASEIYTFYRAGILTGDENFKFNAMTNIKRSEVAAILCRMFDTDMRKPVTLT